MKTKEFCVHDSFFTRTYEDILRNSRSVDCGQLGNSDDSVVKKTPFFLYITLFVFFLEIIILCKLRQLMTVKWIMICKPRSPHGTSHKPRHFKGCRHFIPSMDWVMYHVGIWILTRNITVSKFVCFNKIMKTYFLVVCMFQQNNEDLLFDSLYVSTK